MLSTAELNRLQAATRKRQASTGYCPECGSSDVVEGFEVHECQACGTVFDDRGTSWENAGAYDRWKHEGSRRTAAVEAPQGLREVPVADLLPGDQVFRPQGMVAYYTLADGSVSFTGSPGGAMGRTFTVLSNDGSTLVARWDDTSQVMSASYSPDTRDRALVVPGYNQARASRKHAEFDPSTWTLSRLLMALSGETRLTPEQRQAVEAEYASRMSPQQRAASRKHAVSTAVYAVAEGGYGLTGTIHGVLGSAEDVDSPPEGRVVTLCGLPVDLDAGGGLSAWEVLAIDGEYPARPVEGPEDLGCATCHARMSHPAHAASRKTASPTMYLVKEYASNGRAYMDQPTYDFTDLAKAEAFKAGRDEVDRQNGVYRPDKWQIISITPRTASRHTALGETRVPGEVDTLREDSCPICGADDYRGDTCNSCGFLRPPVIFHDPNTEKAKIEDLRQPTTPVDLACDACGAVFPVSTGTEEEAKPTVTAARQAQQGDLCPSCGKGTLLPKDEVNGVEQDEMAGEVGQVGDATLAEDTEGAGGSLKVLPKDNAQALLDLLRPGGAQVTAARRVTAQPTIPPPPPLPGALEEEPQPTKDGEDTPEDVQQPTGGEGEAPEAEVETEPNPTDSDPVSAEVTTEVPEEVDEAAPEAADAAAENIEDAPEGVPGDGETVPAEDAPPVEEGAEQEPATGGSVEDPSGIGPASGYLVPDSATEQSFSLSALTVEEVQAYLDANAQTLADQNAYLGGTVNGDSVTLSVATNVEDPAQAGGGTAYAVGGAAPAAPAAPGAPETPQERQQVAAALTRRLLAHRRPVHRRAAAPEGVEASGPHRLARRSQKEKSMSTSTHEAPSPERPRRALHQALAATQRGLATVARRAETHEGQIAAVLQQNQVLAAQNEMLRSAVLTLSETVGTKEALRATAGLRKHAEQGGATNGEEVALTDESAAAPEAKTDVESVGGTVATDEVTPDATTDLENQQVAEDQAPLNNLVDVTQEHTQTGDATGEVEVRPSAGPAETANRIEDSGWTTASKASESDERTWAAMHLAQVRKTAGVSNEETMVLAQRIAADASITVEAMETEINALERVVEASKKTASRPRHLVPRGEGGSRVPSLNPGRVSTASNGASTGSVDVSDSLL